MTSIFRFAAVASLLALVAGCATQHHRAPVEDRGRSLSSSGGTAAVKPPPGAENAGKPGYYTVAKGDTLLRIALETGQNYKDIATWNNLDNPNLIEVGQVLRVVPPTATTASAATTGATLPAAKPIAMPKIESRGLDNKGVPAAAASTAVAKAASSATSAASAAATSAAASSSAAASAVADGADADEPAWIWPASGPIIATYEEGKRKGVAIGGREGDPVLAAGDGRVVYAGSGLRGYGNLIIIKHAGDYLTAYAHNKTLLVKEDQAVRKGQKIAEMGSTDADRVQLHFEIRKQGKPIDPTKQLPAR
ncbi:MAG TPA: peptidoglycan DD-metalloendopeptidase family protein [Aquabacterium sp.]|nr:peptidoglycan DD-metalloendopeptidase family protein [Aquabacterium sp.]